MGGFRGGWGVVLSSCHPERPLSDKHSHSKCCLMFKAFILISLFVTIAKIIREKLQLSYLTWDHYRVRIKTFSVGFIDLYQKDWLLDMFCARSLGARSSDARLDAQQMWTSWEFWESSVLESFPTFLVENCKRGAFVNPPLLISPVETRQGTSYNFGREKVPNRDTPLRLPPNLMFMKSLQWLKVVCTQESNPSHFWCWWSVVIFLSDPGIPGLIYESGCLKLNETFADLTYVNLDSS